jgi:hypothetical protein
VVNQKTFLKEKLAKFNLTEKEGTLVIKNTLRDLGEKFHFYQANTSFLSLWKMI